MSNQRNTQSVAMIWSPQTAMLPFNPVLTPGQAYMPMTPLATTPLPYFTFSPIAGGGGGVGGGGNRGFVQMNGTSTAGYQSQPQRQASAQAPTQLQASSVSQNQVPQIIPSAPMLLPAPGSSKRGKLRKRKFLSTDTPEAALPALKTQKLSPTRIHREVRNDKMSVQNLLGEPTTPRSKLLKVNSSPSQASSLLSPPKDHDSRELAVGQPQNAFSPRELTDIDVLAPRSPDTTDREHSCGEDSEDEALKTFIVTLNLGPQISKAASDGLLGFDQFEHKTIIGVLLEDSADPIEVDSGFKCPSCGKKFKFRKHCRRHMINHTGQKPYSCQQCKRTYARKDTCQRHSLRCTKPRSSM